MIYAEEAKAQAMYNDRSVSVNSKINLGTPTAKEETIEELVSQVLKNSFDLMEASDALRVNMLGPWPESESAEKNSNWEPHGLVPMLRKTLYTILRNQHETRTHIAVISSGVR